MRHSPSDGAATKSPSSGDRYNILVADRVGIGRAANASAIGATVREIRVAIGWTQRDLARRAGLSQSWIAQVERGRGSGMPLASAERLLEALGARLTWTVDAPYLADRRHQRDAGHARCVAYVVSRLRAAGWQVATEVEIGGDRLRGWIDVLAHRPGSRLLLVIEVKTEVHDIGAIERTLGWYEREAWAAARRLGWRPWRSMAALLLLATAAVDRRVGENRRAFDLGFPGRAAALRAIVAGDVPERREWYVAAIDPLSRRADWLRPLQIDGRRTEPPYVDYADFVHACHARSKAHRRPAAGAAGARLRGRRTACAEISRLTGGSDTLSAGRRRAEPGSVDGAERKLER